MGRIANIHLAKLWDFMVFYNLNSDDHSVDIFEAFLECDEALSELQDQCEHWKTMYGNACGDQDVLKESIRLLDGENRRLMAENKDLKKRCEDLRKHNVDVITVNNKTIDQLREDNETLASAVSGKDNELQNLQRENDELNKDCTYMTNSRDTWRSRAKHAEAEVEELNKKLTEANDILKETDAKEECEITFTMDKADYKELMKLLLNKAYGASPEYMRDFLKRFCDERCFCQGCPLRFSDCDFDNMSDEEIEKCYKNGN